MKKVFMVLSLASVLFVGGNACAMHQSNTINNRENFSTPPRTREQIEIHRSLGSKAPKKKSAKRRIGRERFTVGRDLCKEEFNKADRRIEKAGFIKFIPQKKIESLGEKSEVPVEKNIVTFNL